MFFELNGRIHKVDVRYMSEGYEGDDTICNSAVSSLHYST